MASPELGWHLRQPVEICSLRRMADLLALGWKMSAVESFGGSLVYLEHPITGRIIIPQLGDQSSLKSWE